ncbi:phosphoribosyl-ATP diphosphatase [Aquiluna sp. KACHI24]|jgi:phosphoribosyl-ATP pyrophosphohydrolase|uniref:phosphoribosyl-ATP diphosphatase n=1 Tax=Aquiluna sp. KACHI24 TaxID=2968831 RepID=UPI0021FAD43B|nr:phosphoribosyl-ATP diphosphatase [Aquiluna sp. KACHI24]BDQ00287.1 phosphoribosyl-ATP pyrophosphatase [Aquiluna sp. KACHI24]
MKSFEQLYGELLSKAAERPIGSRTSELLELGVHAIGKKVVEEAAEVWMAAEHESDEQLALEVSQLIYHLQLILIARGVPMSMVEEKL